MELRNPDPTANPYLALAAILQAGLDGIKNKIEPPSRCDENIYAMTEEQRRARGIVNLPASLREALDELARDEVIKAALGPHICEHFFAAKEREWDAYRVQVHPWEIEEYLTKF